MITAPATAAPSGGGIGVLAAQRQALQRQAEGVLGERASTVAQLLITRDRLADLTRQLDRRSAELAELGRRQGDLSASISATEKRVEVKMGALLNLTREQYKTSGQSSMPEILFSSASLAQVVDRIAAASALSNQAHATVVELKGAEHALAQQAAALRDAQEQASQAREHIAAQRSILLVQAADYESRLGALDASSRDLLARIQSVDAAIAAANRPPTGGNIPSRPAIIQIIRGAAASFGANGDQMVRVADCESGLNPRAYDPTSGASGLFQFMPGTFYGHGGQNIWDPVDQSNVAAQMFSQGLAGLWVCK